MYLVITRSYPPEIGGMQNLMWGLTNSLSKYFMIKVYADEHHQSEDYDGQCVSVPGSALSSVILYLQ